MNYHANVLKEKPCTVALGNQEPNKLNKRVYPCETRCFLCLNCRFIFITGINSWTFSDPKKLLHIYSLHDLYFRQQYEYRRIFWWKFWQNYQYLLNRTSLWWNLMFKTQKIRNVLCCEYKEKTQLLIYFLISSTFLYIVNIKCKVSFLNLPVTLLHSNYD